MAGSDYEVRISDICNHISLTPSLVTAISLIPIPSFNIADRIAMVYQGKLLEVGTRDEIKNSQNPIVQQFIKGEIDGPIHFNEGVDES